MTTQLFTQGPTQDIKKEPISEKASQNNLSWMSSPSAILAVAMIGLLNAQLKLYNEYSTKFMTDSIQMEQDGALGTANSQEDAGKDEADAAIWQGACGIIGGVGSLATFVGGAAFGESAIDEENAVNNVKSFQEEIDQVGVKLKDTFPSGPRNLDETTEIEQYKKDFKARDLTNEKISNDDRAKLSKLDASERAELKVHIDEELKRAESAYQTKSQRISAFEQKLSTFAQIFSSISSGIGTTGSEAPTRKKGEDQAATTLSQYLQSTGKQTEDQFQQQLNNFAQSIESLLQAQEQVINSQRFG